MNNATYHEKVHLFHNNCKSLRIASNQIIKKHFRSMFHIFGSIPNLWFSEAFRGYRNGT